MDKLDIVIGGQYEYKEEEQNTSIELTVTSDAANNAKMPPAPDLFSIDFYYAGVPGNPRLIARSDTSPWRRPFYRTVPSYNHSLSIDEQHLGQKKWFIIKEHPIKEKLESGLRQAILNVLTMSVRAHWISLDFLRLGYSDKDTENPVVIWITVEEDKVSIEDAQRVVNLIYQRCIE
jgi:hypothetical protein